MSYADDHTTEPDPDLEALRNPGREVIIEELTQDSDQPKQLEQIEAAQRHRSVQESGQAGSHADLPTTPGKDKGSAAQSEPISELEQLAQDWIDKNVDSHLGFINWTNSTRRLKDLFILIHQQSFQDGVNKALEALPEPVRYNETTVPKYLKPAEGENWQQALRHEDGYNTAISQAKENIGRLK